jgi:hypothetical protein
MPSNGIPFFSTCLGQRDTIHCYIGNRSAGRMGLWQVTSSVLWMTFESQGKDIGKSGKPATPSAQGKVIWGFKTLYGNSGWRMGRNVRELGTG